LYSFTLGEGGGATFFFFFVGADVCWIKAFIKPELSIASARKQS
jgi:hypothetical protein